VLEFEKDVRIKALKNVTINEPFFTGPLSARPVMPGVLMLEALAQAAALLSFESLGPSPTTRHGGVLRRHRRRALQAAGGARRPARSWRPDRLRAKAGISSTRRAPASTARPRSRPS
jgi:3-hydroxymyristoyl/3-hydroxydecanoyl-(acyl carrier protein) dehydratase